MSTQEHLALLGELIMPRLDIDSYTKDARYAENISGLVRQHRAGGFCVFGGSAAAVARVVKELQELAAASQGNPLLFSCDCEFGLPMRLTEGGTEFPDAMAMAKTGEPELAYKAAQAIGREMRAIGLSWNFAPVADVNSNPHNPIINTRSFGERSEIVAEYASAFVLGLQSEGVAATAKHFPGHGDTSVDSHRELPVITRDWESFRNLELPPFQALIKHGVSSVMTGHLAAPKLAAHFGAPVGEQNLPATLSHTLTTSLLREQLGFDGVIVTDALEMRAITQHFGADEAALLAFEAGADVLLMPHDAASAFDVLVDALDSGRITMNEVQKRAGRIRELKEKTRIEISSIQPERLQEYADEHALLAEEIARKAIELIGNIHLNGAKMIILTDDRPEAIHKSKMFEELMSPFVSGIEIITPAKWAEGTVQMDRDTILVTFHRARGYVNPKMDVVSVPSIVRAMAVLLGTIAPRGLILFGSPYLDSEFQMSPKFVMKTFSESNASMVATAERLQNLP